MRKLLLTTAAVAAAIAGAVAGETAFGTFTDTRDGQTYKTVVIGGQMWMAQNLNYQSTIGYWHYGDSNPNHNSWCYMDDYSYCQKYGRLYDWNTALTVCPEGWHLSTHQEWGDLNKKAVDEKLAEDVSNGVDVDDRFENVTGKKLKAKHGWYYNYHRTSNGYNDRYGEGSSDCGGTDDYGFSALPGGNLYSSYDFGSGDDWGYWWTATEFNSEWAYAWYIDHSSDKIFMDYMIKRRGLSVRCIADNP